LLSAPSRKATNTNAHTHGVWEQKLRRSTDAEATQLVFDPEKVTYRALLEFFYRMHDPTTSNAQGPDRGPQYRSAIFYHSPEQEGVAREVTRLANEKWWGGRI